jgi:hypothetical protein
MQYAEKSVAKKRQENDSSRTARKPDNFGACQDAVQRTLTLGDQFLAEYVAAIYRILENPWLFSIAANGLRPCLIKRFSYIIHFVIEDDQIIVIAVMNAAREDLSFMHRLP